MSSPTSSPLKLPALLSHNPEGSLCERLWLLQFSGEITGVLAGGQTPREWPPGVWTGRSPKICSLPPPLGPEAPLCPGVLLESRWERSCRRWEEKQRVALCAVPEWSLAPEASGFLRDSCHSNTDTPVSSESHPDRGPSVGDGSLFLWMFSLAPQRPHLVTSVIGPLPPISPLRHSELVVSLIGLSEGELQEEWNEHLKTSCTRASGHTMQIACHM